MKEAYSLFELNNLIKMALQHCFTDRYWVRAELSEVRVAGAGHCYVEFVEKDTRSGNIVAKMRGNIWANTFRMLKPHFELETGQPFQAGLKVLVEISVDFHEAYGPSFTVHNIDPTFTVGDMMRQRLEVIRKLKSEEIYDANRLLNLPVLPRTLAIISSATAAGYGDFLDQLNRNSGGYRFYCKLFPALMQGEQAESSILAALQKIENNIDQFDVVVIIRGGGAVSDLSCFDSYLLGKRCATFPLPVITGIGHERDESVLDLVAHTRMKTPTAAAAFLISCFDEAFENLMEVESELVAHTQQILANENGRITTLSYKISELIRSRISRESLALHTLSFRLASGVKHTVDGQKRSLAEYQQSLRRALDVRLRNEKLKLDMFAQTVELSSPEAILRRGYSITLKNGKAVTSAQELSDGDTLITLFAAGEATSIVTAPK